MNEILARTLESIAAESPTFDKSFALVDELLTVYGEHDLGDRLLSDIDDTVHWEVVADLLGILQWSTSDNGHAITAAAEHWLLECDDERKVKIALSLDTYPFTDKEKMNAILDIVARKFPSTKARCAELIASRP
jgi:hypothetical protein